jgi:hypothetical protein
VGTGDTVKGALTQIKSAKSGGKFSGNKRAVIVISGVLTPTTEGTLSALSMVDIVGNYYPHIVLRGDPVTGGVLDAAHQMRVIKISDNDVTLADGLTVRNGDSMKKNQVTGGGIMVFGGTLTMTGGIIRDCVADNGGGVATYNSGAASQPCPRPDNTFTMSGGEITGCSSIGGNEGAAVYVVSKDRMFLSGTARIYNNGLDGNARVGGGIYLAGTLEMNGGTISGNRVTETGGGVYICPLSGIFTMKGGLISGNTSDDRGGGVYLGGYSDTFNLEGGEISANRAKTGGGVYVGTRGNYNKTGGTVSGNSPNNETRA